MIDLNLIKILISLNVRSMLPFFISTNRVCFGNVSQHTEKLFKFFVFYFNSLSNFNCLVMSSKKNCLNSNRFSQHSRNLSVPSSVRLIDEARPPYRQHYDKIKIYQEAVKQKDIFVQRSRYGKIPIDERISKIENKLAAKSRKRNGKHSRCLASPNRATELVNRYFNSPNPKY